MTCREQLRPVNIQIFKQMRSRISIVVDFDNNNTPVIQIVQKSSDDVRDSLVHNFVEGVGHSSLSRWLRAEYKGERFTDGIKDGHVWNLVPIESSLPALREEMRLIQSMIDCIVNDPAIPEDQKQ